MQTARQDQPFGIADAGAAMIALVHFRIVREQQARGSDRSHGLLAQATIDVRRALELHRGHMLDGLVNGDRLQHEDLDFRDEQIRKDHRVRRTVDHRSEEHTSELQSLMRISYAVFCLKKKKKK